MKAVGLELLSCALLTLTACGPSETKAPSPILLFNGTGTSPGSVKAVEAALKESHLNYTTVDSWRLNRMDLSQLSAHQLLIVPGGNYITIGKNLSPAAAANVRTAVQGGLNYLGICAGGLLAGNPPSPSFNLTSGARFDFYKVVNQGIHKTPVTITGVGTPPLEHYWEDGPQFTGWGEVVAKYPDGTPAIAQGASGKGWVLLCGVHPEAPESWRHGMTFTTPASLDNAYAATLIHSALEGARLPHF